MKVLTTESKQYIFCLRSLGSGRRRPEEEQEENLVLETFGWKQETKWTRKGSLPFVGRGTSYESVCFLDEVRSRGGSGWGHLRVGGVSQPNNKKYYGHTLFNFLMGILCPKVVDRTLKKGICLFKFLYGLRWAVRV